LCIAIQRNYGVVSIVLLNLERTIITNKEQIKYEANKITITNK